MQSIQAVAASRPRLAAFAAIIALPLLVVHARAAGASAPPSVLHGNIVNGMVPASRKEELTVVEPIRGTVSKRFQQYNIEITPTQCHLAFESSVGYLFVCAWRAAHVETVAGGNVLMSAARSRAALWRAVDGRSASALVLPTVGADASDEMILKILRAKDYGVFALDGEQWARSVAPGKLEAARASLAPSAGRAAFAAASREMRKVTHSLPAASLDQAVVWGDYRGEQEIRITKLDGKRAWHVPLNGFAQAVVTTPGVHRLDLRSTSENSENAPEREFDVTLVGGHTYIVGYGLDDQPYLEDLGPGVHCERRKTGANARVLHERAWLACMK